MNQTKNKDNRKQEALSPTRAQRLYIEAGLIRRYVNLKRHASPILAELESMKPHFYGACNIFAGGADQIPTPGALVYKVLRPEYTYSDRITKAQEALDKAKARWEKTHKPARVAIAWNVRLS